jgi:hypothetical protein
MIVAIEGPSAAGKTTWCRARFPDHVSETTQSIAAPDLFAYPVEVARFWVDHAIQNWTNALDIERRHGLAVCDGDPFHLYFSLALWRSGAMDRNLFDNETGLYRGALERRQIGFVDHVLWIGVPEDELRRRAQADTSRRRKRHEMYLALVPWMNKWFEARDRVLAGTVTALKDDTRVENLKPLPQSQRYEGRLLDKILATFDS